ncbi:MAG: hypothetical protein GY869_00150 [Planctomycetes bacterium]|nr:hypothetical protein [Planctomycetota bacterium]
MGVLRRGDGNAGGIFDWNNRLNPHCLALILARIMVVVAGRGRGGDNMAACSNVRPPCHRPYEIRQGFFVIVAMMSSQRVIGGYIPAEYGY